MEIAAPANLTRQLAAFVKQVRYEDLPADVRHETKRALLNIVGCTFGGTSHEMIDVMERTLGPYAGPAHSTVIGRFYKTDILSAALINAASSSAHAFDDTHAEAIVHPSGPPALAAIALGEWRGASGRDLLLAIAIGIEITCRLSIALSVPPAVADIGWSQTGVTGGIGAAVASAKLACLDETRLCNAIGIAANLAGGIRASVGTLSNPFLAAQGAQMGLRSALMAEGGFTGSEDALEHRFGFLNLFARVPHGVSVVAGLGTNFALLSNAYKRYPCGVVIQAVVDACLALSNTHDIDVEAVAAVHVEASPETLKLTNRPDPKDQMESHVSTQHWAAIAFVRRQATIGDGADSSVTDPRISAFRKRIQLSADTTLSVESARVAVTLHDGTVLKHSVASYSGSPSNPMSDAELEEKFLVQAGGLLTTKELRLLIDGIWKCETCPDIRHLLAQLGERMKS